MRMTRAILLSALLALSPAAFAAQPSGAQIDRLLDVMDYERMKEQMLQQMSGAMRGYAGSLLGEDATDADRLRLQQVMDRQMALMDKAMAWDTVGPIYRKVYAEVFTDTEVQAMIDFYSSPAGAAILEKMPLAMGRTMQEMQPHMQTLMRAMQQNLQQELQAKPAAATDAGAG